VTGAGGYETETAVGKAGGGDSNRGKTLPMHRHRCRRCGLLGRATGGGQPDARGADQEHLPIGGPTSKLPEVQVRR
jgi:hypothetical protein